MPYNIKQHLAYHVWAAGRLCKTLEPVIEEAIFHEMKSSFPSIAKTIQHMRDAETIWVTRMRDGISPPTWPEFTGGKTELINSYLESSGNLKKFGDTLDADGLKRRFAYKNMRGESHEDVVEDILFHVINHASYHRGQVVTLLREAGVSSILSMDLVAYLRTVK